jgi:hypothetical protein
LPFAYNLYSSTVFSSSLSKLLAIAWDHPYKLDQRQCVRVQGVSQAVALPLLFEDLAHVIRPLQSA